MTIGANKAIPKIARTDEMKIDNSFKSIPSMIITAIAKTK